MVLQDKCEWYTVDTIWISNGNKNATARVEFKLRFAKDDKKESKHEH
ncbi:hypothetical protein UABAM_00351 [Candidatus Uabimicrobium amorphum]|uniref:Uncharacterized protein n=1 Tax=Uabimicrobium amorphum TaxID=2596890 RepID=A0A5S9IHP3_UABAM|nr:hypothetical protein UABAM_00351 [Candidatus Uabimicrobium amorphum]